MTDIEAFTGQAALMGDITDRTRVDRLRAAARRQELILRKSRRRDRSASDYGEYFVIDVERNALLLRSHQIDEIEDLLKPVSTHVRQVVVPAPASAELLAAKA